MCNITRTSIHFLTATGFTCVISLLHPSTFSRRQKYGNTLSSISLSTEPVTTLKPLATDRSGSSLRHQEGKSQGIPLVQQFSSVSEEQSPLRAGQEQSERWTDNRRNKKR